MVPGRKVGPVVVGRKSLVSKEHLFTEIKLHLWLKTAKTAIFTSPPPPPAVKQHPPGMFACTRCVCYFRFKNPRWSYSNDRYCHMQLFRSSTPMTETIACGYGGHFDVFHDILWRVSLCVSPQFLWNGHFRSFSKPIPSFCHIFLGLYFTRPIEWMFLSAVCIVISSLSI